MEKMTFTMTDWKNIPDADKGVLTCKEVADAGFPEGYIGRHTLPMADREKRLIEGVDFSIMPTFKELDDIRAAIMKGIDQEKVRGYHPWQFSGSYVVDDQTLVVATTREVQGYEVEIRTFEKNRDIPRWHTQITNVKRISPSVKDMPIRIKCLFSIMAKDPKRPNARTRHR